MDEYISKKQTIDRIASCYCMDCEHSNGILCRACEHQDDMDLIDDMPVVDVQPADRWIRVEDRLPETNAIGIAHILVYDKMEGVVKADFLDESANYINGSNIFIISNASTQLYKVTHWQPLPEPPKGR